MKPIFRNSKNQLLLRSIFYETIGADKSSVIYTLKDWDHEGYPSLYRLYMELEDVLEYEFANLYLDSWTHWETLCNCTWFKKTVTRWRKELELKLRSKALRQLRTDAADEESKTMNSSNRYLLERGWVDKPTKGRPSKEDVKKAAKEKAEESQALQNDLLRISGTGYIKTPSTAQ